MSPEPEVEEEDDRLERLNERRRCTAGGCKADGSAREDVQTEHVDRIGTIRANR